MAKAAVKSLDMDRRLVLPLLAVAMLSQAFLFGVSYTGASFSGMENPVRDYLAPSQIISAGFNNTLNAISDSLKWTIAEATDSMKQPILAFLGLEDYQYGQPRYTSVMRKTASLHLQPQVLGAFQVNPEETQ